MGTVAERWKIEAVLALVRQVEACDFFVAGEYNPSSKTRAFMRLVEFDYRDVRRIMRGLEVEDLSLIHIFALPQRDQIDLDIREQLIVELYSK